MLDTKMVFEIRMFSNTMGDVFKNTVSNKEKCSYRKPLLSSLIKCVTFG